MKKGISIEFFGSAGLSTFEIRKQKGKLTIDEVKDAMIDYGYGDVPCFIRFMASHEDDLEQGDIAVVCDQDAYESYMELQFKRKYGI